MAAETVALTEHGPEARICAFRIDSVELDHALAVTEEDGVHVVTPVEAFKVRASVAIYDPSAISVSFTVQLVESPEASPSSQSPRQGEA